MFLTIGRNFDHEQIAKLYTRLMRDEILAESKAEKDLLFLHVYYHVCGGLVFGTASLRESIFRRELPLVLEAIRYGDQELFSNYLWMDQVEIFVHFNKPKSKDCKIESCGHLRDYKL